MPTAADAAQGPPAERSVRDGVYTEEQARRGAERFRERCAECHVSGDFQGEFFLFTWSGQGIHILFDYMRSSMPQNTPGSLAPEAYADLLAYILELNGLPPGNREIPAREEELEAILLEAPEGSSERGAR